MCLGVPAIVVDIMEDKYIAIVDYGGVRKQVDMSLVPDIKKGDYVIVHAGAIIEKISKEEYDETMSLLREIMKALE